jgi:hypothetical protein
MEDIPLVLTKSTSDNKSLNNSTITTLTTTTTATTATTANLLNNNYHQHQYNLNQAAVVNNSFGESNRNSFGDVTHHHIHHRGANAIATDLEDETICTTHASNLSSSSTQNRVIIAPKNSNYNNHTNYQSYTNRVLSSPASSSRSRSRSSSEQLLRSDNYSENDNDDDNDDEDNVTNYTRSNKHYLQFSNSKSKKNCRGCCCCCCFYCCCRFFKQILAMFFK